MNNNKAETYIYWFLRLFLGSFFVYSSIHKIIAPAGFAKIVRNYQIAPELAVNIIAVTIPYIELFCGLCLFFGLFRLGALFIIQVALVLFSIIIGINIIRGIDFICGCFSNSIEKTFMNLPWVTLAVNFILIIMGLYLFKFEELLFGHSYAYTRRNRYIV